MSKNYNSFFSRKEWLEYFKPEGIGIEIGVQKGLFSQMVLKTCPNLTLYLLDCWDYPISNYIDKDVGSLLMQTKLLMHTAWHTREFFRRVRIIKGYSNEFANLFPNNFFDFIYIDANHSYEEVREDIELWYPKLKNGGIFSGHDYLNRIDPKCVFGVKSAVDEFCKNNNLEVYSTISSQIEEFTTWFTFKS